MKNKVKLIVGCGIACVLLLIISIWYAITFNNSRLVSPTDFASYTFQIKDLPMTISVMLFCIYVLFVFIILSVEIIKRKLSARRSVITRKLNPKLGHLGFLGVFGFFGFWTYSINESIFPFVFFLFFGFFGFYFEGQMSGTFMDERFRENAVHAQLSALKVTYSIIFVGLIVLCQGSLFRNLNYTLIAVIILLSLALALGLFLSEYLLYRYDHDDNFDEDKV